MNERGPKWIKGDYPGGDKDIAPPPVSIHAAKEAAEKTRNENYRARRLERIRKSAAGLLGTNRPFVSIEQEGDKVEKERVQREIRDFREGTAQSEKPL